MGWLFSRGYSRSTLIERLTRVEEDEKTRHTTLAHCLRGNVLWSVVAINAKVDGLNVAGMTLSIDQSKRFIACYLLDGSGSGWGYKNIDESMHPYYYTCPLKYLEMVPVACKEWREKVYEYHGKPRQLASLKIREVTPQDAPVASFYQMSLI